MAINYGVFREIREQVAQGMAQTMGVVRGETMMSLSVWGSPYPNFVASAPGEPPTNWFNELVDGISAYTVDEGDTVTGTLLSDGRSIDPERDGEVIAAAAEEGSFWDGFAYIPDLGHAMYICPPHFVEPRPYMAPQFDAFEANGLQMLAAYISW